jgi:hypothetical protein
MGCKAPRVGHCEAAERRISQILRKLYAFLPEPEVQQRAEPKPIRPGLILRPRLPEGRGGFCFGLKEKYIENKEKETMKKKLTGMLSFLLLIALLVCCGASQAMAEEPAQDAQEEEEEENYETGDASLDNPRNQDGIGEEDTLEVAKEIIEKYSEVVYQF